MKKTAPLIYICKNGIKIGRPIIKFLLIINFSLLLLSANELDIKPFKKLKIFQSDNLTLQQVYDRGSIYQIRFFVQEKGGRQSYTAFLTKDKKILIFGNAINVKTNKKISIPLPNIEEIKKSANFTYGKGKIELIVITDPQCPYCQQFQRGWNKLKDKYKFYIFLYPLDGHLDAKKMSHYIMSQKNITLKAKALIDIAYKSIKYKKVKFAEKEISSFNEKLDKNFAFGEILGVRGTPAVYNFNGEFIYWNQLK